MRQSESWYISIYIWALTRSFGDILHIKSVFLTFWNIVFFFPVICDTFDKRNGGLYLQFQHN